MSGGPTVAVVGGGIVGTAAAAYLAEAGARVTLFETSTIASAASGRNSGVIQRPIDPVLAQLYAEALEDYRRLAADPEAGFAMDPEPSGLLYISRHREVAERAAAEVEADAPDLEPELLGGAALHGLEPSLADGLFACRLRIGYPVTPAAATEAFAGLATRRGAEIRTGGDAQLLLDGDRVTGVRHQEVDVPADVVVVAAGPWTPDVVDPTRAWRPIRASWGVVVSVRMAAPPRHVLEQAGIDIEPGSKPTAARSDVDFSLVTAAGISAVGSTFLRDRPEPSDYTPALLRHGAAYVPALAEAVPIGLRACARPQSFDGRPLVGAIPWLQGVYVAAGHGPWGISTGPASARHVADLVMGSRSSIDPVLDVARYAGEA